MKYITAVWTVTLLQVLCAVHGQEPRDPVSGCPSGQGLTVVDSGNLHCVTCPPGSFSQHNRFVGSRVCEQCRVCGDTLESVRRCTPFHDAQCAPQTPSVSVWNQRTITEKQAIVIVTSVAAILCGAMILIMVVVWLHGRCRQGQRQTQTRLPKETKSKAHNPLLGHRGSYSSILLPNDEVKAPKKSPLEGLMFVAPGNQKIPDC